MYKTDEFCVEVPESVDASVQEIGEVVAKLEEANAYLTMLASKMLLEVGAETPDEAIESSPEYCNLLYLSDLIESAQELAEKQLSKALVRDGIEGI